MRGRDIRAATAAWLQGQGQEQEGQGQGQGQGQGGEHEGWRCGARTDIDDSHRRLTVRIVESESERRVPWTSSSGREAVALLRAVARHVILHQLAARAENRLVDAGSTGGHRQGGVPMRVEVAHRDPCCPLAGPGAKATGPHRERVAASPQVGERIYERLERHVDVGARLDFEVFHNIQRQAAHHAQRPEVNAAAFEKVGIIVARVADQLAIGLDEFKHRHIGSVECNASRSEHNAGGEAAHR